MQRVGDVADRRSTANGSAASSSARPARSRASSTSRQPASCSAAASARPNPRDAPVIERHRPGVRRWGCHVSIVIVEVNFKSRGMPMKSTDVLTVSEVARRSGFAPSALRFYERERLSTPPGRRATSADTSATCFVDWLSSVPHERRTESGRDRWRAGNAARRPHADTRGLDETFPQLAAAAGRADRRLVSGCATGSTRASAAAASR